MQRLRTFKPSVLKHETLFDMEAELEAPVRMIYMGLWTFCDREGRFVWRPRTIMAEVFPFDNFDLSRVLDALVARGFLVKYESQGQFFGAVLAWKQHQFINNKEPKSTIPNHVNNEQLDACDTCEPRVAYAYETRGVKEGKGREGKGKDASGTRQDESAPRTSSEEPLSPEMVAAGVQQEANLHSPQSIRILETICRVEMKTGIDPTALRDEMVASWKNYQDANISFRHSAEKFFGDGYWRKPETWAIRRPTKADVKPKYLTQ